MATDMEAIRALLSEVVPFSIHVGVRVTEVGVGTGVCAITQVAQLGNHVGTMHAGALFTLAETASGAAIAGLLGDRMAEITPVARSANIKYRKPARGEIVARATMTESGDAVLTRIDANDRTDTGVDVTMEDAQGVVVCEMHVEWHLRRNT